MKPKVKYSFEVWGAGVEVVGLLFLLGAAMWQGSVSDWFTKNDAKAAAYAQAEVQRAHEKALDLLAEMAVTEDLAERRKWHDELYKQLLRAEDVRRESDKERAGVWARQGDTAGTIRTWLFFFGAFLVIVGKTMIGQHKQSKEKAAAMARQGDNDGAKAAQPSPCIPVDCPLGSPQKSAE